jgi:hypothetical protein
MRCAIPSLLDFIHDSSRSLLLTILIGLFLLDSAIDTVLSFAIGGLEIPSCYAYTGQTGTLNDIEDALSFFQTFTLFFAILSNSKNNSTRHSIVALVFVTIFIILFGIQELGACSKLTPMIRGNSVLAIPVAFTIVRFILALFLLFALIRIVFFDHFDWKQTVPAKEQQQETNTDDSKKKTDIPYRLILALSMALTSSFLLGGYILGYVNVLSSGLVSVSPVFRSMRDSIICGISFGLAVSTAACVLTLRTQKKFSSALYRQLQNEKVTTSNFVLGEHCKHPSLIFSSEIEKRNCVRNIYRGDINAIQMNDASSSTAMSFVGFTIGNYVFLTSVFSFIGTIVFFIILYDGTRSYFFEVMFAAIFAQFFSIMISAAFDKMIVQYPLKIRHEKVFQFIDTIYSLSLGLAVGISNSLTRIALVYFFQLFQAYFTHRPLLPGHLSRFDFGFVAHAGMIKTRYSSLAPFDGAFDGSVTSANADVNSYKQMEDVQQQQQSPTPSNVLGAGNPFSATAPNVPTSNESTQPLAEASEPAMNFTLPPQLASTFEAIGDFAKKILTPPPSSEPVATQSQTQS